MSLINCIANTVFPIPSWYICQDVSIANTYLWITFIANLQLDKSGARADGENWRSTTTSDYCISGCNDCENRSVGFLAFSFPPCLFWLMLFSLYFIELSNMIEHLLVCLAFVILRTIEVNYFVYYTFNIGALFKYNCKNRCRWSAADLQS